MLGRLMIKAHDEYIKDQKQWQMSFKHYTKWQILSLQVKSLGKYNTSISKSNIQWPTNTKEVNMTKTYTYWIEFSRIS